MAGMNDQLRGDLIRARISVSSLDEHLGKLQYSVQSVLDSLKEKRLTQEQCEDAVKALKKLVGTVDILRAAVTDASRALLDVLFARAEKLISKKDEPK